MSKNSNRSRSVTKVSSPKGSRTFAVRKASVSRFANAPKKERLAVVRKAGIVSAEGKLTLRYSNKKG